MLWLLGGLDPTGGAGILRDAMTAQRYAPSLASRTVVTAWTRQGHGRPAEAEAIEPERFRWQIQHQPSPTSVKLGLLPEGLVEPLLSAVPRVPWVMDPVLRASDGGRLGCAVECLEPLIQRCDVVTPNLDEARAFGATGDVLTMATQLAERWQAGVLLKGGHDVGVDVVDVWVEPGCQPHCFRRKRQPGGDVRGTGCALATAIACGLAVGQPRAVAVETAIAWLDRQRVGAIDVGTSRFLPVVALENGESN